MSLSSRALVFLALMPFAGQVWAQQSGYIKIPTCGSAAPTAGFGPGYMDASGNICGTSTMSGTITNPTSTLTRPANTTNYAANNLVASSTTAGSVVVPSVAIPNAAGGTAIPRLRLSTNKTTGWDTVALRVRLWSAAPTYANGDGGAYAVATGAAGLFAQFDVTLTQFSDGASGAGSPAVGTAAWVKLASGTAIYWDVQYIGTSALTPASGQTFTLTAELAN